MYYLSLLILGHFSILGYLYKYMLNQSLLKSLIRSSFLKAVELLAVLQALQKTIDVAEVARFSLAVFYAAGQHVRNCSLCVKIPTQLLVHSCVQSFISLAPSAFEVFEILELEHSHPLIKVPEVINIFLDILSGPLIVNYVVVLSITKVSEHVLCVFDGKVFRLFNEQLGKIELIDQLLLSPLDFEVRFMQLFLLILLVLQLESILRIRQHVPGNGQPLLDGVPRHQSQ